MNKKKKSKAVKWYDSGYWDAEELKKELDKYKKEKENKMKLLAGFSLKRAVGITKVKNRISRKIKIPLTRSGRQRKIGKLFGIR